VKITSILVFVGNNLVTFTASHIVMAMLQDLFKYTPAFILRRMPKLPEQPLSSVSLAHQAIALLFGTTCLLIASAFHTAFVFSRSGTLVVHAGSTDVATATAAVQATMARLGISIVYRDTPYSWCSSSPDVHTVLTRIKQYGYRLNFSGRLCSSRSARM
jgi:hypothetical protein